jgi:hypothetical protein
VLFQIVVKVKLSNKRAQGFVHLTRRNGIAPKKEVTIEISSPVKWTV